MNPKPIKLPKATIAFLKKEAHTLTIIQKPDMQWMITFLMMQKNGKEELCTLLTQKGEVRTWAHTDRLFSFIKERFRIENGAFQLNVQKNSLPMQGS